MLAAVLEYNYYSCFEEEFESWMVKCAAVGWADIADGFELVEGMWRELG